MIEIKVGDVIKVKGKEYKVLKYNAGTYNPIYAMSADGDTQSFACWEVEEWRKDN